MASKMKRGESNTEQPDQPASASSSSASAAGAGSSKKRENPVLATTTNKTGGVVKGALFGIKPGSPVDIDIYDGELGPDVFAPLKGAPLLEIIIEWYLAKMDAVHFWHMDGGVRKRSIIKSPDSRGIQEATIQRYIPRMLAESLSRKTGSGHPWAKKQMQ
jgi:hypothetical protein